MSEHLLTPHERPIAGRTILQIVPRLDSGGAERTTLEIAEALAAAGARALVASEGGRWVSELQARGGHFVEFPAASKNPAAIGLNARRLGALIRREGVEIVHARSRAPAWSAFLATRRTGTPFVTTWHSAYSEGSSLKARYNSIMSRGDVVIANSAFTADLIRERQPEAADRISTIPRGVDLRAFAPERVTPERVRSLRLAWKAAPDQRIVLLVGRMTRRKGHLALIEAAGRLKREGRRDYLYVMAGDGGSSAYLREIERAAAQAGIGEDLRIVGHCADMPAAYVAAACVVAPSLEPEAFGRSIVEAQAMGAPVVATDHGAARETILDRPAGERTGWRTPPGNAGALAQAIDTAIGLGAAARDSLALRARSHVRRNFSIERMCARTLNLYEAMLGLR